jgi:hypothetical protein
VAAARSQRAAVFGHPAVGGCGTQRATRE